MSSDRFLLDTHIWYWYLIGSPKLGDAIQNTIDENLGSCYLSPISVWEVGMLHKKGRIELMNGLVAWLDQANNVFPLHEAKLTATVAVKSHQLSLPHKDPADHFIAASAIVYRLTLITVDKHLLEAPDVPTV